VFPTDPSAPEINEKIAVFGDVHGSSRHVDSVFDEAAALGVRRYWCLGDFTTNDRGYQTSDTVAAVDRVLEECEHVVKGNHERYVLDDRYVLDNYGVPAKPGPGASLEAARILRPDQIKAIRALPDHVPIPEFGIELAHSSLIKERGHACDGYRFDQGDHPGRELAAAAGPVAFLGHIHKPAYFRTGRGRSAPTNEIHTVGGRRVHLDGPSLLSPGAGHGEQLERDPPCWIELEVTVTAGMVIHEVRWHPAPRNHSVGAYTEVWSERPDRVFASVKREEMSEGADERILALIDANLRNKLRPPLSDAQRAEILAARQRWRDNRRDALNRKWDHEPLRRSRDA
jgi:predicted phosphodiesterase